MNLRLRRERATAVITKRSKKTYRLEIYPLYSVCVLFFFGAIKTTPACSQVIYPPYLEVLKGGILRTEPALFYTSWEVRTKKISTP